MLFQIAIQSLAIVKNEYLFTVQNEKENNNKGKGKEEKLLVKSIFGFPFLFLRKNFSLLPNTVEGRNKEKGEKKKKGKLAKSLDKIENPSKLDRECKEKW